MTGPPLQGESGTLELQGRWLELLLLEVYEPPDWTVPDVRREELSSVGRAEPFPSPSQLPKGPDPRSTQLTCDVMTTYGP